MKTGLLTLCCLLRVAMAQPSVSGYAEKAMRLHDSIYHIFYDSSAHLFYETNVAEANEKPHSYLWPLCAMIQAANELESLFPGRDMMSPVITAIDRYRSTRPPAPGYDSYVVSEGGGERFYDDNQWIGLAYMDAYQRTKNKRFLSLSEEIYRFMMTGYDTISGGGLYWKEGDLTTKNTCSNGPGILLALKLYEATGSKPYLDTAIMLYQWTNRYLLAPSGVYYDALKLPLRELDKRFFTYNTGTMLESNVLLYRITGKKEYLIEAQRLAKASLATFFKNGRFPGNYWFNAVLLRGYEALYAVDNDRTCMLAFVREADRIWNMQTSEPKRAARNPVKKLLDQAGFLEILARLARIQATAPATFAPR